MTKFGVFFKFKLLFFVIMTLFLYYYMSLLARAPLVLLLNVYRSWLSKSSQSQNAVSEPRGLLRTSLH